MEQPNINVAIMSSLKIEFILYGDFKCSGIDEMLNGKMTAEYSDEMIILKSEKKSYNPLKEVILVQLILLLNLLF